MEPRQFSEHMQHTLRALPYGNRGYGLGINNSLQRGGSIDEHRGGSNAEHRVVICCRTLKFIMLLYDSTPIMSRSDNDKLSSCSCERHMWPFKGRPRDSSKANTRGTLECYMLLQPLPKRVISQIHRESFILRWVTFELHAE